jgi:ribosomal protein S12 methylthiotransferase
MLDGLFEVPQMARYIDMPIQHASPRLLRAMNRPYTAQRVREQCATLRQRVPDITLRTTVIVGFPGETERDFEDLCRFVDEVRFDRLGIFTYSQEPGTPAATLAGRPRSSTALRRLQALTDLQMHWSGERAAARIGSRVRLLVDAPVEPTDIASQPLAQGTVVQGRSQAEALDIDGTIFVEPGSLPPDALRPGQFVEVEIVAADVHDLRARPLGPLVETASAP